VGPLLDLAVVALAIMVSGSLALLAWTLGVGGVRAVRDTRRQVVRTRLELSRLERRLRTDAAAPATNEGDE
jgi:hypothetical protein